MKKTIALQADNTRREALKGNIQQKNVMREQVAGMSPTGGDKLVEVTKKTVQVLLFPSAVMEDLCSRSELRAGDNLPGTLTEYSLIYDWHILRI